MRTSVDRNGEVMPARSMALNRTVVLFDTVKGDAYSGLDAVGTEPSVV